MREQGLDVAGIACDVTAEAASGSLVAAALDRWGRLDTVVANAGVALDEPGSSSVDALDRMFALHVRSVWELASAAMPVIARAGGGAFIVMSSIAGLRGNRILSGYGVTKAANAQIARNLAVQWGPSGVRANAISPGVIETEFARPITDDPSVATTRRERTPLRRFGRVEEVAGAVVWLASPAGADHRRRLRRSDPTRPHAAAAVRPRRGGRRCGRLAGLAGRRVRQRSEHRDRRRDADLGLSVADGGRVRSSPRAQRTIDERITPINARHHQVQLP